MGEEMRHTLGKEEKLRHKTLVDGLFESGTTLYDYPLRLTYRVLTDKELTGTFRKTVPEGIGSLQMLITVPKKKLKHAVDRVRMRRLIRESYRLNRLGLKSLAVEDNSVRTVSMAFIYMHSQLSDYASIEKKMKKLLDKVSHACFNTDESLTQKTGGNEDT